MKTVQRIEPRAYDTQGAATYCGKSMSSIRNTRYEDMDRIKEGKSPKGPQWVMQGRNIRYYKEDLDTWLDSFKEQDNPAWDYHFQSDTTHLKNQNRIDDAEPSVREASNNNG